MKATLTLDDDVADLLDRARRERGRSPEELANELLRWTLRRLGVSLGSRQHEDKAKASATVAPASAGGTSREHSDATLEAEIDQIYDELRDLVARSAADPGLLSEVERKRGQLHALQVEEAKAWRQRADAGRYLRPGEGYQLLERATRLLEQ